MIIKKQYRDRGVEHFIQPTLRFVNSLKALSDIIASELFFGGKIVSFNKTSLKIEAKILQCIDTSIYIGEEVEMSEVLAFVNFYLKASQDSVEQICEDIAVKISDKTLSASLCPNIVNRLSKLKFIVISYFNILDKKDIESCLKNNLDDVFAAIELAKETNCSICELLSA